MITVNKNMLTGNHTR